MLQRLLGGARGLLLARAERARTEAEAAAERAEAEAAAAAAAAAERAAAEAAALAARTPPPPIALKPVRVHVMGDAGYVWAHADGRRAREDFRIVGACV